MLGAGTAFVLGLIQCSEFAVEPGSIVGKKGRDCEKGDKARGPRKLRSEKAYHDWVSSRERRRRSGNLS